MSAADAAQQREFLERWRRRRGMARQGETPMVIGPDIILDLVFARGRDAVDAVILFDAIAADTAAGVTSRRAHVAPATVSEGYSIVLHEAGVGKARSVAWGLLELFRRQSLPEDTAVQV